MLSRTHRLRVLVPVDFSDGSSQAVHHAAAWANHVPSELHVVHAVDSSDGDAASSSRAMAFVLTGLEERSLADLGTLTGVDGHPVPVHHHIAAGGVPNEIVRLAGELRADLVVMGAAGSGGTGALIGSVARRVVAESTCPVVVVPAASQGEDWHHILSAVDFSAASRVAMNVAADVADRAGVALVVLHAARLGSDPKGDTDAKELLESWRRDAQARSRTPVSTVFAFGAPETAIVDAARRLGCSLIVLGEQHRLGIGAVLDDVARRSSVPVMTVHPTDAAGAC